MNNNNCAICLEIMQDDDKHSLLCKHKFHKQCFDTWIKSNIIMVNKTNKWGRFVSSKGNESDNFLLSIYDSGEFTCPICKCNYTLMHPLDLEENMKDCDYAYRKYNIKIKYVLEGTSINELWFSQYIENFDDFRETFNLFDPGNDNDKYGVITKNLIQINLLTEQMKNKNEILILHALKCNCVNPKCIGFFFVPEVSCPLCSYSLDSINSIILPDHIDHASVYQIRKCMEEWNRYLLKHAKTKSKLNLLDDNLRSLYDNDNIDIDTNDIEIDDVSEDISDDVSDDNDIIIKLLKSSQNKSANKSANKKSDKSDNKKSVKSTDKNADKNTVKSTDKDADKNKGKSTNKNNGKNTGKKTDKITDNDADKNTEKNTEKNADKNNGKKTNKNTDKDTKKNKSTKNNIKT